MQLTLVILVDTDKAVGSLIIIESVYEQPLLEVVSVYSPAYRLFILSVVWPVDHRNV